MAAAIVLLAFAAVARDISGRTRAERALRQSEDRLRQVVRLSHIGIFDHDHRTGEIYWSPEQREIFGCGPHEKVSFPDMPLTWNQIHPDDLERVVSAVKRAHEREDGCFDIEFRLLCRDGSERWVTNRSQTFFEREGPTLRPIRTIGATQDISERKRWEEVLRTNEERLRQVARVYDIGVFDYNHLTGAQYWSPELRRHADLRPDEPAERARYITAVHPDDRERVAAAAWRAFDPRGDGHFEVQHRVLTAQGTVRWLESRSQTFFEGEGSDRHPVRTVGATVDITASVAAQEALKESLHEKETLLREVHHRVKNNLQIIASLLHFQAKKIKDPRDLAAFSESRDRLRSMILVHERLYQSQGLARIDFGSYLRSLAVELQRSQGVRSGRQIEVRVTADDIALPVESALPCGMIVCELLTNTFKYAFPGDRSGSAQVRVRASGDKVRLTVSDDGVGLPSGFDPQHTTSFGWQLIQNLTAQLGGSVDVESRNGTSVSICFQLQPESDPGTG